MEVKKHLDENAKDLLAELNDFLKQKGVLAGQMGLHVDKIRLRAKRLRRSASAFGEEVNGAEEQECLEYEQKWIRKTDRYGNISYELEEKCIRWKRS